MPLPNVGNVSYDRVKGIKIPKPLRDTAEQSYVVEAVKGLGVTMRHFFKNTKSMLRGERPDAVKDPLSEGITTLAYPEQKRPYPERFRGVHRLTHRVDGSPRCVACLCCSTACPAQCIYIEAGEYPEGDKRRGYERYPVKFVIDELRCIFCGFCVEACPCDAIRMDTGVHAVPYDTREQFIYGKAMLMSMTSQDGKQLNENPRVEPGEKGFVGIAREGGAH
ncbi:MAG: NuoI/complex I 23 kDa subunit family protein [Polyangiales bacterium]